MKQTFKELKAELRKVKEDRASQERVVNALNNELQVANAKNKQLITIAKQLDNELAITNKLLKLKL